MNFKTDLLVYINYAMKDGVCEGEGGLILGGGLKIIRLLGRGEGDHNTKPVIGKIAAWQSCQVEVAHKWRKPLPSEARALVTEEISARADGSLRSRVCTRETLRSAPHQRERKFSGTCVWSEGGGVAEIFNSFSDQLSRQIR